MTRDQAADVAEYAKGLFPRTTALRFVSLASAMLDYSNPNFARQCLMEHSHKVDDLSIPTICRMLDADEARRNETAIQRKLAVTEAQRQHEARRAAEQARIAESWAPVNATLDPMDDTDLDLLKADVVKEFPWMAKANPRTHKALRALMHARMTKGQAGVRAQVVVSYGNANLAADFDVDAA